MPSVQAKMISGIFKLIGVNKMKAFDILVITGMYLMRVILQDPTQER